METIVSDKPLSVSFTHDLMQGCCFWYFRLGVNSNGANCYNLVGMGWSDKLNDKLKLLVFV